MKRQTIALATITALLAGAASARQVVPPQPQVEVCFVLDTTGSMGGLIAGAKEKIWSIANDLTATKPSPQLKIGLVAYRDRGDDYITKNVPLTDDLDAIYEHLMGFQAKGGGDTPESVNQGLHEAIASMEWSKDERALKLIFLVGDCPPHMDYQDDVKYIDSCKTAVRRDIIINTVLCGANTEAAEIWKEIARAAEGSFAAIEQTGGMAAIKTPVDARITELTRAINGTVIAFGTEEKQAAAQLKLANAEAAPASAAAARGAFFSDNLEGKAISGSEDLVAEVAAGSVELDAVTADQLPARYRKFDKAELSKVIAGKDAERAKLQAEMAKLVAERKAYVKKELEKRRGAKKDDGFDAQIRRAVKEQGARKGMDYSAK